MAVIVIAPRTMTLRRRLLAVALCYVLGLHAVLAGVAMTSVAAEAGVAAVICHAADSTAPADGDRGIAGGFACDRCALAHAAGALPLPNAGMPAVPMAVVARLGGVLSAAVPVLPRARAGLSRAPPAFA